MSLSFTDFTFKVRVLTQPCAEYGETLANANQAVERCPVKANNGCSRRCILPSLCDIRCPLVRYSPRHTHKQQGLVKRHNPGSHPVGCLTSNGCEQNSTVAKTTLLSWVGKPASPSMKTIITLTNIDKTNILHMQFLQYLGQLKV